MCPSKVDWQAQPALAVGIPITSSVECTSLTPPPHLYTKHSRATWASSSVARRLTIDPSEPGFGRSNKLPPLVGRRAERSSGPRLIALARCEVMAGRGGEPGCVCT